MWDELGKRVSQRAKVDAAVFHFLTDKKAEF